MGKPGLKRTICAVIGTSVAGWAFALPASGAAKVTAVPQLDLARYMGSWYEIARLPNKTERKCVSEGMVLYALGDQKRSFQIGTSCQVKGGTPDEYDGTGKADKQGDGRLKLSRLVLFSTPYWVLALGPSYEWALVGSPNHKTLWILSRSASLDAGTLAQIKDKATAEGYDVSKLILVAHHS